MKFAFLLSGAGGFLLVALVGLASGRGLEPVLRDAALACLACGFVGRWFWRGLERAFVETLSARRSAAAAAEEATAPAADSPSSPAQSASARPGAGSSKPSPASPPMPTAPRVSAPLPPARR
jgi:hypothetical protein